VEKRKVEASLITAVLCSIETRKGKLFRFCIPSGVAMDYEEMEVLAKDSGVRKEDWLRLLIEIEKVIDKGIN
jgi:hypothetical protein